jgi:hypothetical protein
MGIEDILRKLDLKRSHGAVRHDSSERELHSRLNFAAVVTTTLVDALLSLRDKAIGSPVPLPIAAKPSETPVFIECEGMVRLTLRCHVRADLTGKVYCSAVDIGMSRNGGRIVRTSFEPLLPNQGRPGKLGVTEKQFGVDATKFRNTIEGLAHQL